MRKYLIKRILFSIFSIFVVVGAVMMIVYSAIDRSNIFNTDPVYSHLAYNEKTVYEYSKYEKYGYLTYSTYGTFVGNKYKAKYGDDYATHEDYKAAIEAIKDETTYKDNADVKDFYSTYSSQGYEVIYLPTIYQGRRLLSNATLLAKKEYPVIYRLWTYFSQMFQFETIWDVSDPDLTNRGIHIEWDTYSNMPALVGNGTRHKYLIYFDDQFPFIHQNIVHINLGVSYSLYRDDDLIEIMQTKTGSSIYEEKEPPAKIGTGETVYTSYDFHTLTYNMGEPSELEKEWYPDKYTIASSKVGGLSRMGNSFIMGIIATIGAYLLGIPIGIWMAKRKDKIVDKVGNLYIIFIMAVPSLAYIFMFAAIGTSLFKLPYKFANATVPILGYILPTISLMLPSVGGLMKWMRRYMIDQQNSDYVKFARAEGLSEGEIFSKHISRNAMIYLVHGIPASILGALTGAIITEGVYSVPGVGKLLTDSITQYDNGIIIAMTLFYTTLSVLSLILGDLLLVKYDPRISLTDERS